MMFLEKMNVVAERWNTNYLSFWNQLDGTVNPAFQDVQWSHSCSKAAEEKPQYQQSFPINQYSDFWLCYALKHGIRTRDEQTVLSEQHNPWIDGMYWGGDSGPNQDYFLHFARGCLGTW